MPPISHAALQASLSMWLPYLIIAAICLAAGFSSLALAWSRRGNRLLLWVGIFATIYSLRLFCANDLIRIALGISSLAGPVTLITYLIPIPTGLYFRELLGRGWKSSIQIWVWLTAVSALVELLLGFAGGYYAAATGINSTVVVGGVAIVLAHLLSPHQAAVPAVVRYCTLLFLVVVIPTNFGFRPGGRDLEPYGFFISIAGLAYAAAQLALAREQRIAAVASELATARRIQTSILPRSLPELAGLRIAAVYRPMTEVAGDFYDFLRVDDRRLTILIADVSGHGVPAALIASMLKVAFAQQAAHAADPAAILSAMNQILSGVLDGQFVTAACAHVDLEAGAITYAGAGHPPAFLRNAAGEIVELAENGLFLGPFRHAQYKNITAPFRSWDRLLLYTDGIPEATAPDGEPFGEERLRQFFAKETSEPEAVASALVQTAATGTQEDDLTVLIAEAR